MAGPVFVPTRKERVISTSPSESTSCTRQLPGRRLALLQVRQAEELPIVRGHRRVVLVVVIPAELYLGRRTGVVDPGKGEGLVVVFRVGRDLIRRLAAGDAVGQGEIANNQVFAGHGLLRRQAEDGQSRTTQRG